MTQLFGRRGHRTGTERMREHYRHRLRRCTLAEEHDKANEDEEENREPSYDEERYKNGEQDGADKEGEHEISNRGQNRWRKDRARRRKWNDGRRKGGCRIFSRSRWESSWNIPARARSECRIPRRIFVPPALSRATS